jgi:poly(A) polymerase Pap1
MVVTPCLGADFVKKVIGGTAEWSELFEKHDFFYKYKYYLQITASTGEHNLQIEWYMPFYFFQDILTSFSRHDLLGLVSLSLGYDNWS